MTAIIVTVHRPQISGDTVRFTWDEQGTGLPEPPDGGLFYRYEGINLSAFSNELWLEIFLALRLRTYKSLKQLVSLHLPVGVPRSVIDFWLTYHEAENVTVSPVSESTTYERWQCIPPTHAATYDTAVFFGGGRDSLSTACLLGEVYGRDRTLLIQCIDPHRPGEQRRQEVARRFERFSLGPARDRLGFATQRIWTNVHAIALGEGGKTLEPHIEQYIYGTLPVLLTHQIPISAFGYTWGDYVITEDRRGKVYHYSSSRPEMLAAMALHLERSAGVMHLPVNINLAVNGGISFALLAHRYPDAFPHIMSCQPINPEIHWCHNCAKCGRYAVSCMQEGIDPPDFNLNRFFAVSGWIERLIDTLQSAAPPLPGENVPWKPGWCGPGAYQSYCQAFYQTNPAFARQVLGRRAWYNFQLAVMMYGNRDLPINRISPAEAYTWMPAEIGEKLKPIIGTVASIEPLGNRTIGFGNGGKAMSPFALPFHHPVFDLPHLQ